MSTISKHDHYIEKTSNFPIKNGKRIILQWKNLADNMLTK